MDQTADEPQRAGHLSGADAMTRVQSIVRLASASCVVTTGGSKPDERAALISQGVSYPEPSGQVDRAVPSARRLMPRSILRIMAKSPNSFRNSESSAPAGWRHS